jgi:cytochrome c1
MKIKEIITESAHQHDEDDYEDCRACSGTGEGRHESETCYACHGSGVQPVEHDDDYDDYYDEPDDEPSGDEESHYEKYMRVNNLEEQDASTKVKYGMPGFDDEEQPVQETIVKKGGEYEVQSKAGKNLGHATTKKGALKRLGQVEYFKHHPSK